jgi:hypothetical protein
MPGPHCNAECYDQFCAPSQKTSMSAMGILLAMKVRHHEMAFLSAHAQLADLMELFRKIEYHILGQHGAIKLIFIAERSFD